MRVNKQLMVAVERRGEFNVPVNAIAGWTEDRGGETRSSGWGCNDEALNNSGDR